MAVLVLWDVDHTLIDNGGASRETYTAAFTALTAVVPTRLARTSSRTDRLIMREMFRVIDLDVGAYGSDSDDRADLVRLALRRASMSPG